MSDLVSRLAARATGHSTTARPLTPSRFEASPSAGRFEEVESDPATAPPHTASEQPAPSSRTPSVDVGGGVTTGRPRNRSGGDATGPAPNPGAQSGASPRSSSRTRGDAPARVTTGPTPMSPQVVPSLASADGAVPVVTAASPRQATSANEIGESAGGHGRGEPTGTDRIVRAESVVSSTPPSFGSAAATATTPTVQVHIGRLDVRANLTATPPPTAPVPERSEATRSLEDYLDGKRSSR